MSNKKFGKIGHRRKKKKKKKKKKKIKFKAGRSVFLSMLRKVKTHK